MKTIKNYTIMAVSALLLVSSAMAAYDVIAVDVGNSEITRMDIDGNIVWQKSLGSSEVDAAVGPDGNIFVADNTNRRLRFVGAWSGEVSTYYADGLRCIAVAFGPDYNGDGISDLYLAGEGRLAVIGGPGNGNSGSLLAINNSVLSGNSVSLAFGPDETTDGKQELYLSDGDANLVSVVDGMDITSVVRTFEINISLLQGSQIIGDKIYYADANTQFRNFIAWYNIDGSSSNLTRVLEHPAVAYPRFFEVAPDGKIYIPNRQATENSDNSSIDVYDSNWTRIKTIYQKPDAHFASVTFVPVDTSFKEFLVTDSNTNNKLYKYNQYGELLWESEGNFRNTGAMIMGPDDYLYTFSRGANDYHIKQVNPADGTILKYFYNPGSPNRCYEGVFAYDYNDDGVLDLYALVGNVSDTFTDGKCVVTGYSSLTVISGPGAADEGTVLAEVPELVAGVMTSGPDVAGPATQQDPNSPDGVAELYLAYSANLSKSARGLYIIEPTTLRMVKAYEQCRDDNLEQPWGDLQPFASVTGMAGLEFGPDGYLYAGSHYNLRVARFSVVNDGGDISIVRSGIGDDNFFVDGNLARSPMDLAFAFDKMYIANRFQLGDANVAPGVVSVINGDATLDSVFATIPGTGRADSIVVIEATGCPVDYPADLNGDCFVDGADIAIFAQDWLVCTDPVIENCP